jgi:hypothetical protein
VSEERRVVRKASEIPLGQSGCSLCAVVTAAAKAALRTLSEEDKADGIKVILRYTRNSGVPDLVGIEV